MAAISNFLVDNVTSREALRTFEGVCSVMSSNGSESFSAAGVEVSIVPVQKFLKRVDGAWYLSKTFSSAGKIKSLEDYGKKGVSGYMMAVHDGLKLTADTFSALKFLGGLGVGYLAPRVKVLGLVKNAASVYCAVYKIALEAMAIYDAGYVKTNDDKRGKKIVVSLLSIFGFMNSFCLNGFGALQVIVGSDLAVAGKQGLTDFAFNSWKLGGSISALVGRAIREIA